MMAKFEKAEIKCWQGCEKVGTTRQILLVEVKMVWSLWKTGWPFFSMLNTVLPYEPAIPS